MGRVVIDIIANADLMRLRQWCIERAIEAAGAHVAKGVSVVETAAKYEAFVLRDVDGEP